MVPPSDKLETTQPERDSCLTDDQVQAFQEAFELFDKNGGGTIDAAELQRTLADVGINVNGDDLIEIMRTLDHDGNGEVDFAEFLNLMTSTDLFLAAINPDDQSTSDDQRKRVILFDVLTKFMKKQALKGVNELIGYYSKKYKKVTSVNHHNKGAHVIGHYADGAKVIGLTDVELYKQLKRLTNNKTESSENSPYASNDYSGLLRQIEIDRLRSRQPLKPFHLGGPRKHKNKRAPNARVTLKVVGLDRMSKTCFKSIFPPLVVHPDLPDETKPSKSQDKTLKLPSIHRPGWTSQQMAMNNVDIKITQKGYTKVPIVEVNKLKKIIDEASEEYLQQVAQEKLTSNLKFYQSLNTRKPRSNSMYKRLKETMVVYSAASRNGRRGMVNHFQLERALEKQAHHQPKPAPSLPLCSKKSDFAQFINSNFDRNYVQELDNKLTN
jgi:hypothetical protein